MFEQTTKSPKYYGSDCLQNLFLLFMFLLTARLKSVKILLEFTLSF